MNDTPNQKSTVIIADNSTTLRHIIKKILEEDYDTIETKDGAEVLSLVESVLAGESSDADEDNNRAIVIIGFQLGVDSGTDIIANLRQKYSTQELPIILNSSDNKRENIHQAIAAGINDYVVKPFPQELLLAKVQNLLARTSQQSLEASQVVSKIPFFTDVPADVVAQAMDTCAVQNELEAESVVCSQGENNFDLHVLMEGECNVLFNDQKISEIKPVNTIGEMGFLENENRSATVVTNQPSVVITFDKEKFDNFLNEDRAISEMIYKNVIHTLSNRLKNANELLEQLSKLSSDKGR